MLKAWSIRCTDGTGTGTTIADIATATSTVTDIATSAIAIITTAGTGIAIRTGGIGTGASTVFRSSTAVRTTEAAATRASVVHGVMAGTRAATIAASGAAAANQHSERIDGKPVLQHRLFSCAAENREWAQKVAAP